MPNFLDFLKALVPFMGSQRDRDETYLAEALNLADLERRLHEIEAEGRCATSEVPLGLGLW